MFEKEKFMDVSMVSQYLHIARSTTYKWVSEGSIQNVKIGTKTLFIKAQIDQWIYDKVSTKIEMDLPEVPTFRNAG